MSKSKPYKHSSKYVKKPRAILLYAFLIPLFISVMLALFQTNIMAFLSNSFSFFMFFATARLTKEGLTQEQEYKKSTFTKAPKIPYKLMGSILLALSTLYTAWIVGDKELMPSLFLAIISFVGYILFYGLDPKEDKFDNLGDVSASFVLDTIEDAKNKLSDIDKHIEDIKDILLVDKLNLAVKKARLIVDALLEDPKDIRVARKFLVVYMDGMKNVIDSYMALGEKSLDADTKIKLYELMDELDVKFDSELERLKKNNQFDLDVHIDVLKEQIKN